MNNLVLKLRLFISHYNIYIRSSFLYLLASFLIGAISIALNPFLAKNLSPEDYAIIGYFSSFNKIISSILGFGLLTYYQRNYFFLDEKRRLEVSDTILIALLIFGFGALILLSTAFYLFWKFNNVSFPFFPYALLTFAPLYLGNFITLLQINYRLKREAGNYAKISIVYAIINAILAITLVIIYKYGATGRLLAALLASLGFGF
jgi:O-antigen/teichoic acid export membrane protein